MPSAKKIAAEEPESALLDVKVRSVALRIIRLARADPPMMELLREVAPALAEQFPCDSAELRWREGDRLLCCEVKKLCPELVRCRTLAPSTSPTIQDGAVAPAAGAAPADDPQQGPGTEPPGDRLIIPLLVEGEDCGLLLLEGYPAADAHPAETAALEHLARLIGFAFVHHRERAALRERVKELTCLGALAQLAARPGLSLDELLREVVRLLPPAWQYPEVTQARIVLDGRTTATPGYREGLQRQSAPIVIAGSPRGSLEVCYLEQKPELGAGPFLAEERRLLETIATQIGIIVERREAAESLLRIQEQLLHTDRLATIGRLAAEVAHELNEPLGNILGFAQLALRCPELPQQPAQDLGKIVSSALAAREIIRNLLVFGRQAPAKKAQIRLNDVVTNASQLFRPRCRNEGIDLVLDLQEDLPELFADPTQLNQVLVNLLVNAIQAMPEGGRLVVRTSKTSPDAVQLVVEDTGIGMDEEVQRRILLPFFTTKDVQQGTGLGLSVVHGIVTAHGGTISVASRPRMGSRFTIQLPLGEVNGCRP